MKLVTAVKRLPTRAQARCLKATLARCKRSSYMARPDWLRHRDVPALAYVAIRTRFGLTAQAAVRTIGKLADAFKINQERVSSAQGTSKGGKSGRVLCHPLTSISPRMMPASNANSSAKPATIIKLIPLSYWIGGSPCPSAPAKPHGGHGVRRRRPGSCGWRGLFRGSHGSLGLGMIRCRCRQRISKARMRRYQNCGKSNCRESKTEHVTFSSWQCRKAALC